MRYKERPVLQEYRVLEVWQRRSSSHSSWSSTRQNHRLALLRKFNHDREIIVRLYTSTFCGEALGPSNIQYRDRGNPRSLYYHHRMVLRSTQSTGSGGQAVRKRFWSSKRIPCSLIFFSVAISQFEMEARKPTPLLHPFRYNLGGYSTSKYTQHSSRAQALAPRLLRNVIRSACEISCGKHEKRVVARQS